MKTFFAVKTFLAGCIFSLALFAFVNGNAQTTAWTTNPFDRHVFVENKGQLAAPFDGAKYMLSFKGTEIYFFPNGITYRHAAYKSLSEEVKEKIEEAKGKHDNIRLEKLIAKYIRPVVSTMSMEWEGCSPQAEMIGEDPVNDYFTYADAADKNPSNPTTFEAKGYRKIIYRNIYPGIDVEYTMPEGGDRIKYSLIVRAGANPADIRMRYEGAKKIALNENGDLHITSAFGNFIDQAPETFYRDGDKIQSAFVLNNNTVSFYLEQHAQNKDVIIDPWTTVPTFPGGSLAFDIDYDNNGNVFVYGGMYPWSVIKLNNLGVIQWTFTPASLDDFYGDFFVDHASGRTYISEGWNSFGPARILKLSANGALLSTFSSAFNVDEMWRIAYNACTGKIVVGCGNTVYPISTMLIDTNLTTYSPVNSLATTEEHHDITLLAIDQNSAYCLTPTSLVYFSYDNALFKVPMPGLAPMTWNVNSAYSFDEFTNFSYVNSYTCGFNGIAVGNYLYTYDGAVLKRWNKSTGAFISSLNLSATYFLWAGLDVDECENIYVGMGNQVRQYNSSMALTTTYACTNTVYDLKLGPGNKLYACGNGFVSSINLPPNLLTLSSTASSLCPSCTGTATATGCITSGGYSYLWTPSAQTTLTATGLCPGLYTLSVYDNCSLILSDTITVQPGGPSATVTANFTATTVCVGQSTVFTDNSTVTSGSITGWQWNFGDSFTSSLQNPTHLYASAGNYTVTLTVTASNGCTASFQAVVTVSPSPVLSVTPSSSICTGQSLTLTATGATTYAWSPSTSLSASTGSSVTATPASTTTYTVTGNLSGCTATAQTTVTVNPVPALSVSPNMSICTGQSLVLTAGGASTYSWSPSATLSSSTGSSVTATPTSTTTYTVTGNLSGCTATLQTTVTVNPLPVVSVSPSITICAGQSVPITAAGASTYAWSPSATLSSSTGSSVTATPASTTTYTVTGNLSGCTATAQTTVTVNPMPAVSVSPNSTICTGQSFVLTAGGASTYSWSPSASLSSSTGSSVTATPTSTTTYTVTGNLSGCSATAQTTVTVNPLPALSVSPSASICTGQSVPITAAGASTYSWSPSATLSASTGSNVTATPVSTTTYTVTGNLSGCTATAQVTVTVSPLPLLSITANDTVCAGQSATLTAGGANTYSWSPSATLSSSTGSSVTATPASTTTYTVIGDLNGCTASAQVSVMVNPVPAVSVSPNATICAGQNSVLSAIGAPSYSWTPAASLSSSTGSSVTATPASTTTYTVTGNQNGCTASAQVTVTVNPLPAVSVSPNVAICTGQSVPLTAAGASSYSWSPSATLSSSTGPNVTATPASTTTYSVTGTSVNGCTATAQVTVTVSAVPLLSITPNSTICSGQSAVLTANGANTYAWSPSASLSSSTGSSVTAQPSNTTTYTVLGDLNGCTATIQVTVTVNPVPSLTVSPNATICNGQSSQLNAAGANTYVWSPSSTLSASTSPSVTAIPSSTTTYTVVGDLNGCTATAQVTVTVNPLPVLTVSPNVTICNGQSSQLNAGGANTYIWNPSSTLSSSAGSSVAATPSSTTTYTVTGDLSGCTATAQVTVTVNPLPIVLVSPAVTICNGQSAQLTSTGANTYSWNPSSTLNTSSGSSVTAIPASTTTYTVTGDLNGCTATAQVTVTVNPLPVVLVSPDAAVCSGQSAQLSATGASTYIWSPSLSLNSSTGPSVTATPSSTVTYTVTGNSNGCTSTAQVTVTVGTVPSVIFTTNPASGCAPLAVQFTDGSVATPGSTYSWNFGDNTSSNLPSPNHTFSQAGTFTVSLTISSQGCSSSASSTVTVYPNPVAGFTASPQLAEVGTKIHFTDNSYSNIISWKWDFGDTLGTSITQNPVYIYDSPGHYIVQLLVSNIYDCVDSTSGTVIITEGQFEVWIPNVFTPNGDHHNDVFNVSGLWIAKLDMSIFDRWGMEIFHTADKEQGWNGRMNGGGAECQMDTYVYLIKAWDENHTPHQYTGHISLVR